MSQFHDRQHPTVHRLAIVSPTVGRTLPTGFTAISIPIYGPTIKLTNHRVGESVDHNLQQALLVRHLMGQMHFLRSEYNILTDVRSVSSVNPSLACPYQPVKVSNMTCTAAVLGRRRAAVQR